MRPRLPLALLAFLSLTALPAMLPGAPKQDDIRTHSISVTTTDDSVHTYITVEPWAQDFIKGTRVDGGVEFVPLHRIRMIREVGDITDRVIADHKKVGHGTEPETVRVKKNKTVTFRGYPYPETKWFFVVQPGVFVRISGADNPSYVFIDWGVMRNLGPRWAVGANLHSRLDDLGGHALMIRGRRWWNRSISTDLAAGFQDLDQGSTMWLAQAHLNLGNVASFSLEMQRWSYDYSEYSYYYPVYGDQTGTRTSWNAGGTIGYVPGLVTLGLALGAAIVISVSLYE